MEVDKKLMDKILLRLKGQQTVFNQDGFIKQVPRLKRPLAKIDIKLLNNLVAEVEELMEDK